MRKKIFIRGVVQGVGYRPFVYRLAQENKIRGWVNNSSHGVEVHAEGSPENMQNFERDLQKKKPPFAVIHEFESVSLEDTESFTDFKIIQSREEEKATVLILPDLATCPECRQDILDSAGRRYFYPFTNCTNCGPRFSIIRGLPYDRPKTTMAEFTFCPECEEEYHNPENRRFHAQPNACACCGPSLSLTDSAGMSLVPEEPGDAGIIHKVAEFLQGGKIIALKGLGGYQLLADARNEEAVRTLRERKHRERKPLAAMFPSLESARAEVSISPLEEELLLSASAPIVLLERKQTPESGIAPSVAFGNPRLGIMLPYTPLHHLLLTTTDFPVVATSGNLSNEPICIDNAEALRELGSIADFFLSHNRPIERAVDDSVVKIVSGEISLLRRARGHAPLPIRNPHVNRCILATGAHLKNTVALSRRGNIFLSQHIGDLENEKTYSAFTRIMADLESLLEITPEAVVSDKHPGYLSTEFAIRYARERNIPHLSVQHHYAHILSVIAEHRLDTREEKILGVSWDGTGYGDDGDIWGSEFLLADSGSYERIISLEPFFLPGSEKAVKEPWRVLFGIFRQMSSDYDSWDALTTRWERRYEKIMLTPADKKIFYTMLEKNLRTPRTTSMGRLFDAVSALCGFNGSISHEGEASMSLEYAITGNENPAEESLYSLQILEPETPSAPGRIRFHKMIEEILADLETRSVAIISRKFHNTLAHLILQAAQRSGLRRVALSGGVFQNHYLIEKSIALLRATGFTVYTNRSVPVNDGGISLGQAFYGNRHLSGGIEFT